MVLDLHQCKSLICVTRSLKRSYLFCFFGDLWLFFHWAAMAGEFLLCKINKLQFYSIKMWNSDLCGVSKAAGGLSWQRTNRRQTTAACCLFCRHIGVPIGKSNAQAVDAAVCQEVLKLEHSVIPQNESDNDSEHVVNLQMSDKTQRFCKQAQSKSTINMGKVSVQDVGYLLVIVSLPHLSNEHLL